MSHSRLAAESNESKYPLEEMGINYNVGYIEDFDDSIDTKESRLKLLRSECKEDKDRYAVVDITPDDYCNFNQSVNCENQLVFTFSSNRYESRFIRDGVTVIINPKDFIHLDHPHLKSVLDRRFKSIDNVIRHRVKSLAI